MGFLRSVRVRLTLWYVLLLAVILAGFSAGVYLALRANLNENLNDSLDNRADFVYSVLTYDDGRPGIGDAEIRGDTLEREHFVRVFDASGEVTFDNSDGTAPAGEAAVAAALAGESSRTAVNIGDEPLRVLTRPVFSSDGVVGAVQVGLSEGDYRETLDTLILIIALAYPLTVAVASAGGAFLAGRALGPIDSITQAARRISAEDLNQRLDLPLPDDEVGRLARTFDEMIARLEGGFRRQRQFTADASHELRTPLTAIKGQLEVALSRERDAQGYREVLQAVNEESDRLIRLTGSLLTLARADAGGVALSREHLDVGALVSAVAEQVAPAAEAKGVRLAVAAGPPLAILADEDMVIQLLLNLMDNAVKYTESGGDVHIGWRAVDTEVEISVRDTGAGIEPEHLSRIFDRFYRADPARSRAEGGAGLGLSICRWIAEAHGGTISVESVLGEGSMFTVRLPAA